MTSETILKTDAKSNFIPGTCCSIHRMHDKRELGFFKEKFRCTEKICYAAKLIAAMATSPIISNLAAKDLKKGF